MTSSVAKKARNAPTAGSSRICSNGGSGENKHRNGALLTEGRVGPMQLYTMDVNRRENQNCYNCGGFGHLARNYRNRRTEHRIEKGKELEYGGNENKRRK